MRARPRRLTPWRERVCRRAAKSPDSVYSWACSYRWFPAIQPERCWASSSEKWRLLLQGAVTINGEKPRPWDVMPLELQEVVFFKGSKKQITVL